MSKNERKIGKMYIFVSGISTVSLHFGETLFAQLEPDAILCDEVVMIDNPRLINPYEFLFRWHPKTKTRIAILAALQTGAR